MQRLPDPMIPANAFPKITVATATYNRADLLPETMDSILAQDYPNLEYIVLDDGSSDNTAEIMKPYLEKYPHIIRFESHANMGEARTVNKAWEMATGDYFMVIASDDPQPSRQLLKRSAEVMQANLNCVATYPDWVMIDQQSRPVRDMVLGDWDLHYMVRNVVCFIGPGALINRKKLFGKIPYLRTPKYRFVSDYDCWLRIGLHGDFVHIPEMLAAWREHEGSATIVNNGIKIASELQALYDEYFSSYDLPPAVRAEEARVKSYLYMVVAKHTWRNAPHKSALYLAKSLTLCPTEFFSRFDSAARAGVKKALRLMGIEPMSPIVFARKAIRYARHRAAAPVAKLLVLPLIKFFNLQFFGQKIATSVPAYYSPLPDIADFKADYWQGKSAMRGIKIDGPAIIKETAPMLARYAGEFRSKFPLNSDGRAKFHLINGTYMAGDAHYYYALIRDKKPRRIIEIGSGNSTILAAEAIAQNKLEDAQYACHLTAIEPYPSVALKAIPENAVELITSKLQDIDLAFFETLGAGDILFIDSTHVLRENSDVQIEFLEILPRLRKNVFVHIHDISLPKPYPKVYFDAQLYWTEQYILQAYLMHNEHVEITWPGTYLMETQREALYEMIPEIADMRKVYPMAEPSAFWFKIVKDAA